MWPLHPHHHCPTPSHSSFLTGLSGPAHAHRQALFNPAAKVVLVKHTLAHKPASPPPPRCQVLLPNSLLTCPAPWPPWGASHTVGMVPSRGVLLAILSPWKTPSGPLHGKLSGVLPQWHLREERPLSLFKAPSSSPQRASLTTVPAVLFGTALTAIARTVSHLWV